VSVRTRLILTFALVGVILVVPAVFAARGLTDLRDLAVEGRGRHAQAALAVGRVEAGLAELDLAVRAYVGGGERRRDAAFLNLRELEEELASIESAGYVEAAPPLGGALQEVREQVFVIDSLVRAAALEEATDRVESDFEASVDDTRDRLLELASGIDSRAQADFERARSIGAAALRTTLLAVLTAIGFALVLSAWTTRALTRPLQRLRTALASVTEGVFDIPSDLPYERRDEIGELSVSFGIMSRRLAELDRLRAEFLGVASHELKTPINVIRGYTELIEEELAGEITPHQREIMQRIGAQTETLTRQVSRLMDISRLETGNFAIEPEPVNVSELVTGLEKAFEVMALEKGLTLDAAVAPDTPEDVLVDPDLIRDEVLTNLISNALKFTPEGGRVSVRASGEKGGVSIEVSDTGPGIPPEHRPHIFDKYYQVERSRSIGSGLGLAIAREAVEAHGGTLELVERDGPGAAFRVHLPAAPEQIKTEVRISS
jgi:two-component system sensor histidine kinase GlrK